jgi:hypothetical protein
VERGAIAAAVAALAGIGAWLIFRPREASATSPAKTSTGKPSTPSAKPAQATQAAQAPKPAAPAQAPSAPATSAAAPAGPVPTMNRYETALDAFGEPDWVKVSTLPGRLVTRLPLRTTGPEQAQGIVWARATERTAQAVAKRFGARLPTAEELKAVASAPEVTIVQACTFPSDNPAIRMESSEAARQHDACVARKLGDSPEGIPFTIGKFWVNGSCSDGKKPMYGFFSRAGDVSSLIQKGGCTTHKDLHVDYSSTVFLVKELDAS